jgi:RHS repeat-associated protein
MQKNDKHNGQSTIPTNKLAEEHATQSNAIEIPQISLPKGGGAIKGIDEKFQVNAANGTASFSIPLPLSPNRNGFTPQLSLSYNSGAGNGLFGMGWDIDLPSIQRRTDKKLPRYFDTNVLENIASEDSFMFSGVEELVPLLDWKNETWKVCQFEYANFIIRQYQPRIEGSFARIERIFDKNKQDYYWKVTSKEHITTFFGYSENCRIADPNDANKVFQWLPEFAYDDKGSWVWYSYKAEDLVNVANTTHEKNRFNNNALFVNKHIKTIIYGNEVATYFDENPYKPALPINENYFFTLVFDYGEHDKYAPKINDNKEWVARNDAFSSYRSCFEVRTYRLCQRVLMFHNFAELGGETLVRSTNFEYKYSNFYGEDKVNQSAELVYLTAIEQKGYIKTGVTYSQKALPIMTFDYQWLTWNKEVKEITAENLVHAPIGLSANYQWTDLYNEGINGILTEQANAWYYKSNLGNGEFSKAQMIMPKPSFMGLGNGTLQLQDLDANGEKQLVVNSGGIQGYFELTNQGEWQPFKTFLNNLNIDLKNPNIRMLDVNGDGKPEVVLSDEGAFWFWENEGKIGYDTPELATKPYDEEQGATLVFQDQEQRIFLADMSGDGMTDIVRVRNGEVCYWANMGYGRFAPKVTMSNSPIFDDADLFNPSYIQLADISGTGATDIIYLGKNKFNAYLNYCGNAWSKGEGIEPFFPTEQPNKITVTDLLGNGTSCLVWSSEMPAYSHAPMRYIDLMGGIKPHIMKSHENGMGKKTEVEYKSSTHFYLEDKKKGANWITKLAFPVQVVAKTIITDSVTNVRFSALYTYHHGYYDHAEREFRGFGRVEQLDTAEFEITNFANLATSEHHQPPVLTKTWFHNGYFISKDNILSAFENEYWEKGAKEFKLPDALLLAASNLTNFDINSITAEEWREALRACKGMTLRQEIFGLDAQKRIADEQKAKKYEENDPAFLAFQTDARLKELIPYTVATHNCEIQLLQNRNKNRYASFLIKESESMTYNYERDANDPRITHTLNLETDELGNVLQSIAVVYPRQKTETLLADASNDNQAARNAKKQGREGQQKIWITLTQNDFTKDLIDHAHYYLRKGWQTKTYELTGIRPAHKKFSIAELKKQMATFQEIEYQQKADNATPQKRLVEHIKTKFYKADLTSPLPDGEMAIRAIPYEAYQLAYTPNLLATIFTPSNFSVDFEVAENDMKAGKFLQDDTNWWIQSGTVLHHRAGENFEAIKNRFFAPVGYIDPFDSKSEVFYDAKNLFMQRSVDALGNENQVLSFDYRTLSPTKMKDLNDNLSSIVLDELGLVKAVATEGKDNNDDGVGEEGDNLKGINDFTNQSEKDLIQAFFDAANVAAPIICAYANLQSIARQLLGNASARMVYDFSKKPTVVASIAREQHQQPNSPLQISFEYTDGLGKVAMKKVQAETGKIILPDGSDLDTGNNNLRWVGNGRTVLNNKGNPIKQYEPYFSTTPAYETDPAWVERGVSPIMYYDGMGRNVRTELPNGTFTKVEFDAWKQITYDTNDTVLDSNWYKQRKDLPSNNPEKKAADKAALHHNTPSVIFLDTLGRPTLELDHNKWQQQVGNNSVEKEEFSYTFSELDIEGNALSITDARGNKVMAWGYDMLGHRVTQTSMDAGKRWMLNNALGNPVKTWDERAHEFSFEYDTLHRPTKKWVKGGDGATPLNHCYEIIIYGEATNNPKANNLSGKAVIWYDTAGKIISSSYDFKGNLLSSQRIFVKDYKNTPHWDIANPDSLLEGAKYAFTTSTEYDALNRPIKQIAPDSSETLPKFNEAGLLEKVSLKKGNSTTEYVKNIDYDAKGQRTEITYGNGVTTQYEYDPLTFRLQHLMSNKATLSGGQEKLQDLAYTYDPTGNITQIHDRAVPTVFFNNQKIEGRNEYTYDALYRLITATGREQNSNSPNFDAGDNWNDTFAIFAHNANDPMAMRHYTQHYQYDSVGNILQTKHEAGANGSWTRNNIYGNKNNRLKTTSIGNNTYTMPHHIQHGYMVAMPHLSAMSWTFKEELQATAKQVVNKGIPETTYYVYDSNGQRARKVTENAAAAGAVPNVKDERIYVGAFEVYRHSNGLERETLHIMDDKQRIAMLDTETEPKTLLGTPINATAQTQTIRYQMGNHLGSSSLELDEKADVISYEEYHPYGTTAYQAKNASIKATAKRYRYTGMERDEETGLAYHSARYYIPWIGRWLSCDPIGVEGGINIYFYVSNRVITNNDKTGNFEEPVHGALTYHLALAAGFTERDAAHIALATAAVDHDPPTNPVRPPNIWNGKTAQHHFPSFETALTNVKKDLNDGTSMNLNIFGTHLHALEDVGFSDAPGPHLRRTAESKTLNVTNGMKFSATLNGISVVILTIPPVNIKLPILAKLLFGTSDSQHQHIGIAHPFYITESGKLSTPFNHIADQAPSDPKANKLQLKKIYNLLKDAAKSYYGKDTKANDEAAYAAIDCVIKADKQESVNTLLNRKKSFSGSLVNSYAWWVDNNNMTRIKWKSSQIDSSIITPPYRTWGDGTITDTKTKRTWVWHAIP